ncbi:MAG TPA: carboxylesterase family protein [Sphingobium sp.]|nr:carboxylesterase family protein [Sphingobium sp.]
MIISTSSGPVSGRNEDGVVGYSGIRYGQLRRGRRFDPVAPFVGKEAQDPRPLQAVFPQSPSRLRGVMGTAVEDHPQEEDAFLLNIWAPEDASDAPVLIFLHGGAFVSGGSGVRWYDGGTLAREGKMIVVGVNYRLGALAHLLLDAQDEGNRALGDLSLAMAWIRDNVAAFGGDPGRITLSGQSAGGFMAKLLAIQPDLRDGFRGLVIMSSPGIAAADREDALALSRQLIDGLEQDPRDAPIQALLDGQRNLMMSRKLFGKVGIGLMPTEGGGVPGWLDDASRVAAELRVDRLLVTATKHETTAFFGDAEQAISYEQLDALGYPVVARTGAPYWDLIEASTEARFRGPARRLSEAAALRGIDARFHEITAESELPHVRGAHGFDTPFLFGNFDDWRDAPMLEGFDRARFERESKPLRELVIGFVHG